MSDSRWYHGTDVFSGVAFLNGMGRDAADAAQRKIDGPPGFFLAQEMAMKYTASDLCPIDSVDYIRRRPQMFVRQVSGMELASQIVVGACLLTDKPVTLHRRSSW